MSNSEPGGLGGSGVLHVDIGLDIEIHIDMDRGQVVGEYLTTRAVSALSWLIVDLEPT